MQTIADRLGIHPFEVYSVVTFYAFLNEKYHGRFVIRLCRTISADMVGKEAVARQLKTDLGIDFGQTTPDGRFTLEWANCIGMVRPGTGHAGERITCLRMSRRKRYIAILAACEKTSDRIRRRARRITYYDHWQQDDFSHDQSECRTESGTGHGPGGRDQCDPGIGMKGRGGAGFPTGVKWNLAAAAQGEQNT